MYQKNYKNIFRSTNTLCLTAENWKRPKYPSRVECGKYTIVESHAPINMHENSYIQQQDQYYNVERKNEDTKQCIKRDPSIQSPTRGKTRIFI